MYSENQPTGSDEFPFGHHQVLTSWNFIPLISFTPAVTDAKHLEEVSDVLHRILRHSRAFWEGQVLCGCAVPVVLYHCWRSEIG